MSHVPRHAMLCAVVAMCFPATSLAVDPGVFPTDVELIKGAMSEAIRLVLPQLPLKKGDRISLKPKSDHKSNWMIQDVLTQMLLEEGHQVVHAPSDSYQVAQERPPHILRFRIAEIWLNYTHQKGWFRTKVIYREGGATCSLTLAAPPDNTIIWAQRIHARHSDRVPAEIERLLGDSTALEPTFLDKESRWVESIVVLGLVTGFVYLSF